MVRGSEILRTCDFQGRSVSGIESSFTMGTTKNSD